MGIHNYEKSLQSRFEHIAKSDISERNKKLIVDIANDLMLDNLSKPRIMKYLEILRIVARKLGKDFDQATKEDLKLIVGEVQQSDWSPWTKQTYKVIVRRFYAWLHGMKGTGEYPEIVKWISIRMSRAECRLPAEGDLLHIEDIEKMLQVAEHPRDKALIAMLWDSGSRMGEIGDLKFKNIHFDSHGAIVTVRGKTGSRNIRLIWCVPYLATWIDNHPFKNDPEASLWVNVGTRNHHAAICYANFRKIVLEIAKKAGIKKRVHPHLFRHSRATFMADHLTEFQMNQYFGWIQGSKMAGTYVHMNGKNLDDAILAVNGMKSSEEVKPVQPRVCSRCKTINGFDTRYCRQCGGVLDVRELMEMEERLSERQEADKMMNMLMQDQDIRKLVLMKLKGEKVG